MVYFKGAPDKAGYFGHRLENFQRENKPFWTPVQQANSSGSLDTMQKVIDHIRKSGVKVRSIGVELAFLPLDAGSALKDAFPAPRSRTRCSCSNGCVRSRRRTNSPS